jgi:hypothetical protein
MANVRFKTTIELDVEVVGHYTGETPARGMMGPPEDSEPGEPADFEIEAVLLMGLKGEAVNVVEALGEGDLATIRDQGIEEAMEQMEDAHLEQQIAREEARRDAKEDR